jgi:tripartite-type tricarboxylate transporter receptor subunit TctC
LHKLLAVLLACLPATLCAQTYPTRPLTWIAPSTPGSAPDVLSRVVAQKLSEQLGQPIAVVNRPGAGTNIGTAAAAQAAPDGYTLLLGSIANAINPHIMSKVGYRLDELAPVSSIAAAPDVLVVHPSVAATSVLELVAELKGKPGTPAGHAGMGTTPHLSLEMFRRLAGVDLTPVPFQGGGAAQQGILSGQIPFMFSTTIGILPRVRSGQLRALAVSSPRRIAAAPEIPTMAESGVAGFDVVAWFGLFVPAGTPRAIVERLSDETRKALGAPEVRKRLIDLGAEPLGSSPEEFAAYVNEEFTRWGKLAKEAGIRID